MTGLARGTYRYWRDGVLQNITEPWSRSTDGADSILRGQRIVDDRPVLDIEARYSGARCTALRLIWQPDSAQASARRYELRRASLEWRSDSEAPRVLDLPEDCLLYPLLRVATGPLLQQLLETPRWIVVPDLHRPTDSTFLQPLLSERRVLNLGDDPGQGRHYRYLGGEYGEAGCECWLDPSDVLLRYRWLSNAGDWDVRLDS